MNSSRLGSRSDREGGTAGIWFADSDGVRIRGALRSEPDLLIWVGGTGKFLAVGLKSNATLMRLLALLFIGDGGPIPPAPGGPMAPIPPGAVETRVPGGAIEF